MSLLRQLFFFVLLLKAVPLLAQQAATGPLASALEIGTSPTHFSSAEEAEIRQRLAAMPCLIDKTVHPVVESYIKGYMLRNRVKAEHILGRIPAFFPLFEEELRKAGMPDELKYLAIVESALDPTALSRSGAGGLWQFMPGTGLMFGLQINKAVDERRSPELATKAAVEYLRQEYERFGDWALVLAAYNGGPGRLRRAMRRSGKKNFWELRRYLPRETRNYVPAFIAATYLHTYGHLHGLAPREVSLDEQFAVGISCPYGVSLVELAQATELSLDLIKHLNPHCKQGYVPAAADAVCRVPARSADAVQAYLDWRRTGMHADLVQQIRARPIVSGDWRHANQAYHEHLVELPANTSLASLAHEHDVSEHHLRLWNRSARTYASAPQQLSLYRPIAIPYAPIIRRETLYLKLLEQRQVLAVAPTLGSPLPTQLDARMPTGTYRLQRYESLLDVWRKYADAMTWQEFVRWNGIDGNSAPAPGTALHIRS